MSTTGSQAAPDIRRSALPPDSATEASDRAHIDGYRVLARSADAGQPGVSHGERPTEKSRLPSDTVGSSPQADSQPGSGMGQRKLTSGGSPPKSCPSFG